MSLLAEIKRRNVFRVLIIYLAGSWLLLRIADVVLPRFGLPDRVLIILIIVVAIGFVPALVISWAFEWLEKALAGGYEIQYQYWNPFYENLRRDPRWPELISRYWFTEEELAAVEFELFTD